MPKCEAIVEPYKDALNRPKNFRSRGDDSKKFARRTLGYFAKPLIGR